MKHLKRIGIIIALFLFSFTFIQQPKPQRVEAAETALTWTSYNLYSTKYELLSEKIYMNGSQFLAFTFPESTYHRYSINMGSTSRIMLWDSADNDLDMYYLLELRNGDTIGGSYLFDIVTTLGYYPTLSYITIHIAQDYSSTPVGYIAYMNAGSTYDVNPSLRTVNFWTESTTTPGLWLLYDTQEFINIPTKPTNPVRVNYQFVHWVDSDGFKYNFTQLYPADLDNDIYNLYAVFAPEFLVQFMNGLVLHEDQDWIYYDDPQYYPWKPSTDPTRTGYTFLGWKTRANEFYNFDRFPTQEEFNSENETEFILYAAFTINSPTGTAYPPNTPNAITAIATLLNAFGMYNYPALMFLFVFFVIVINGIIAWYFSAPAFVYVILTLIIAVFFMFMNLIPLYVMIPLIVLLITGLIISLKEGAIA